MTDTTNSSGWITTTGEVEGTTTNLASSDRPTNHQPDTRFGGGWVSGSTGEMKPDISAGEYTIGQDAPAGGSIMDTVKSPSGSPIGDRNPNGKDVITVGGMTTPIAAAVYAGLLVRNHDGSYSDPTAPVTLKDPTAEAQAMAPAKAESGRQKEAEPQRVTFGEAGNAAMADLMARQNPGDLFKTVDSVLHRGDVDKATIGRMASMAGVEPEAMHQKVMTVWQGAFETGMETLSELLPISWTGSGVI